MSSYFVNNILRYKKHKWGRTYFSKEMSRMANFPPKLGANDNRLKVEEVDLNRACATNSERSSNTNETLLALTNHHLTQLLRFMQSLTRRNSAELFNVEFLSVFFRPDSLARHPQNVQFAEFYQKQISYKIVKNPLILPKTGCVSNFSAFFIVEGIMDKMLIF